MIVYQAFRYELDPTNVQRGRLASHAGGARYAWNWALEQVKTALQARATGDGKASVPNAMELHRMWNVWKKQPGNCAWWSETRNAHIRRPSGISIGPARHTGGLGESDVESASPSSRRRVEQITSG
jgi:hypothetical protein